VDADQADTRIGNVVDGWTLDGLIGIGGMAAVYSATRGDERRAVKVLNEDLTRSQRALDRFRREGDVLRSALHAAVPRVHASGTTNDGSPYLVMDLLLGETVDARRRRFGGRLPWAEVLQIANVVLDVLAAAHARGVLHRDIKPSNVLWLDDGSIRVIDFGIARALRDADDAKTRTGELPGSLPFMSPEHALGVPDDIDERSDLWSLGATMFLLLSGRPVHESATDIGALALSASKQARSLGSVVSGLPPALVATVDRALAFEKSKRFADAAEMRAALASDDVPRASSRIRYAGAAMLATAIIGAWTLRPMATAPAEPPVAMSAALPVVDAMPPPSLASAEPNAPAVSTEPPHPLHVAPKPVASAPPKCDPPFVIDPATGTRRVKPGC
jgi:serine/threonine-protein kinase